MTTNVSMPRAFRQVNEVEPRAAGRGSRYWQILAVVAPILTAVLYWHISQDAVAPRTPWDENHLLQMARLISGDDNVAQLSGSGYYPGWAFVLAPVWWFTQDPASVYTAAVTISNVLGVATIVPLALLGRYLGLTVAQSVVASSIVMMLPARSVLADYALSEQLVFHLFAWVVLGAFALWRHPSWWRMALFVVAVGAVYFTHPRAIALVATAAIWLLAFALRRWLLSLLGLLLLAGSYVATEAFVEVFLDRVLLSGYGKDETLANTLANFDLGLFAKVFMTQTWVQVVGTAGLFALGCVIVIVWTFRELRTVRLGVGAFLFGFGLSTMLVSAIWWTRPDILFSESSTRLDAWTYSRYIDPVSAFIVFIAVVALIRGVRSSVLWSATGIFALGAVPVLLKVAPEVPLWGRIGPSNSAILSWTALFPEGPFDTPLLPTFTNEARFWLWATAFVFACIALFLVLRHRPRAVASATLVVVCVLAILANPSQVRPYPGNVTRAIEEAETLAFDGELADVDFDLGCVAGPRAYPTAINWFPYWLSPRVVRLVDTREGEAFGSDLVISCREWPLAEDFDARAYSGRPSHGYRLWVLPGEVQDELEVAGALE
ncbi:hypothetical protein [Bogoriella caseilytica]|uniref:Glycosyltransferase RgtA/B/C/D-like domain-containing protein n=1 Tax=Bogoriella caseilytica TaxID=56055 RepID=A0A3N2BA36_9MICO|nr:hypothetical protein [Bogoriella caseilytica]ROR72121.1 hypothetical protein EDD31_0468 [Bogoriella caseilytica]